MRWKVVLIVAYLSAHRVAGWVRCAGFSRLAWGIDEVIGWNAAVLRLPKLRRDLRIM
jgi:hypothetical protein